MIRRRRPKFLPPPPYAPPEPPGEKITVGDFLLPEGMHTAILFGSDPAAAIVYTEDRYVLGKLTSAFGLPGQKSAPYVWLLPRNHIRLPKAPDNGRVYDYERWVDLNTESAAPDNGEDGVERSD